MPATDKFGGDPALVVSGQVKVADAGDKISPKFNFHNMYIAGPDEGDFLPRVRFDGLGVGLKTGSIDVEATAIAVDGNLPSLYRPNILPADVEAEGFLAQGKLDISGWASMTAAMGFLELKRAGTDPRHAFFIYGQANRLAEPIDTPVGRIYLREFGFGFGYRYTLAGIARAETATSPRELVKILDEVSKFQGNLNTFEAWEPTYDNRDMTLALRGMFALSAASTSQQYNADKEKELPNPLLFDIVAALRTDLTFLINLRGWLSVNYHDWTSAGPNAGFKRNPLVNGYLYFSVPRKEFLARMVSNPQGHVGNHPTLPSPLIDAIRAVKFSATLYIRPGLFHSELGWPYELGFDLGKPSDSFYLRLRGGLINRIEDLTMLYGMAFSAEGLVRFEGKVGNDNFGAAALATAEFSLQAKILSFLSLQRFSDSMFYGHLRFDLTLTVSISVWISFKIFRKRIRLSAGFSLHFAVSIGLEAVITPRALGGRAHVAVGIRAFGRTLSVGIGLSFNDGALNVARARVARFMTLGLGTEIPPASQDGKRVEALPRPNVPRAEVAQGGDAILDTDIGQAQPPEPLDTSNLADEENFTGQDFTTTDFWAMLFPLAASETEDERFIMTLVPRDLTDQTPAQFAAAKRSTFYDAPQIVGDPTKFESYSAGHTLELKTGGPITLGHYASADHPPEDQTLTVGGTLETKVAVAAQIDGDDGPRLGQLLATMFLQRPGADGSIILSEPSPRFVEKQMTLPTNADASAEALARIGRSRIQLAAQARREEQIEEARSSVLASVVDTARRLAASGSVGEEASPRYGEIDARDFGLTFVISRDDLRQLFVYEPGTLTEPPVANFTVNTKSNLAGEKGAVYLFNPPERMFQARCPALAPTNKITAEGISLDWDLEPQWRRSASTFDDPEYHLDHYEIERRIDAGQDNAYFARFTVKAVAPARISEGDDGRHAQLIKTEFQFIDDLRTGSVDEYAPSLPIPTNIRDVILGRVNTGPAVGEVTVSYVIQPVDIAGTKGLGKPCKITITEERPRHMASPLEVTLQFVYPRLPSLSQSASFPAGSVPALRLLVVPPPKNSRPDGLPSAEIARMPVDGDQMALRVWRDRALPSGGYGSDALTQGKMRPTQDQIDGFEGADVSDFILTLNDELPRDRDSFDVRVEVQGADPETTPPKLMHATVTTLDGADVALRALSDALHATGYDIGGDGILPAPGRSARIFLKSLPNKGPDPDGTTDGEWRTVSPNVVVLADAAEGSQLDDRVGVNAIPETFEQPVALSFMALRREDMAAESGRLHLFAPTSTARVSDLLDAPAAALEANADSQRRTATRLTWNARPRSLRLAGRTTRDDDDLFRWVAGFEVFQLDPDRLPGTEDKAKSYAAAATTLGDVRLLPAADRGLSPGAFGDFQRIEAAFPSHAWRTAPPTPPTTALSENANGQATAQGRPWLSLAETAPIFPEPRVRRLLLADFDEGMIADLFAEGRPDRVIMSVPQSLTGTLDGWELGLHGSPKTAPTHDLEVVLPGPSITAAM
ncbi:MAG: hypothetical protein AAGP08_09140, partial [Pseudomonadota bacterium]